MADFRNVKDGEARLPRVRPRCFWIGIGRKFYGHICYASYANHGINGNANKSRGKAGGGETLCRVGQNQSAKIASRTFLRGENASDTLRRCMCTCACARRGAGFRNLVIINDSKESERVT